MEFPTKRQVKQIPFSNSSDIGFKDFTTLYKTYTTKAYSILVNDTTLVSDNPCRLRNNLLVRM